MTTPVANGSLSFTERKTKIYDYDVITKSLKLALKDDGIDKMIHFSQDDFGQICDEYVEAMSNCHDIYNCNGPVLRYSVKREVNNKIVNFVRQPKRDSFTAKILIMLGIRKVLDDRTKAFLLDNAEDIAEDISRKTWDIILNA